MERRSLELSVDFLEFLNDPGIEIRHPSKVRLLTEDLFVFPDLKLSGSAAHRGGRLEDRIISSRDLIEIEQFGPVIIISGPGDSGKTTLLKSLLKHYLARGFHPLYVDGNDIDRLGEDDLHRLRAKKYEEQYTKESLKHMTGAEKEKKICLFDNFDSASNDAQKTGSLLSTALDVFGFLIFTVKTPFLADVSLSETDSDGAPLCFELMEYGLELRRELTEKWHALGTDREREAPKQEEIKAKIESAMNIMDEVIGRNLVPSYPVFILTILYIGESQEKEALTESSYGHYYEYLITKPLKERIGKDAAGAYILYLSRLANKMFIENKSSVTAHELIALRDEQSADNELPGQAEDTVKTLLDTRTLRVKESGYVFTYRHIYYYFAAKYLADNLDRESVKDDVRHLCGKLGDEEYANILLFLTHLTDDPFILAEIADVMESSEPDIDTTAPEEEITEIDKLIDMIDRLADKDRKLRELRAEYAAVRERIWVPPSSRRMVYEYKPTSGAAAKRRHLEKTLKELRLLGIAGELLKKRLRKKPGDVEAAGFARKLYLYWLRSLGAASKNLLKPEDILSSGAGSSYKRDESISTDREEFISAIRRYALSLNLFGHYLRRLSQALGDASISDISGRTGDLTPGRSFELFDLARRPWPGEEGIPYADIESLTSAPEAGKFARELLRQRVLAHLRMFYTGTPYEQELSRLEEFLALRDTKS